MGKKSRFIQVFNPLIRRWVKIDRDLGKVIEYKETKGPYPGIPKYRPSKPKKKTKYNPAADCLKISI